MRQKYFRLMMATVILLALGTGLVSAQLIKTVAKNTALVNEQYIYDVNVYPLGDSTFFLDKKPTGMTINANTGLITWTPTHVNQGAQVTVRVTVGSFSESQTFFVYISDAVVCDAAMVSYWKLDEANYNPSTGYADFKGGYKAITGTAPDDTTGVINLGQRFDAARDIRLTVTDSEDQYDWNSGDDVSASLWFRSRIDIGSDNGPQVFLGRLGSTTNTQTMHWWWFGLDTNNYVAMHISNDAGTGPDPFPNQLTAHSDFGVHFSDNVWHHAVFTLEGNSSNQYTLKIYVDGVLQSSGGVTNKTFDAGDFTSDAEMNIGWWDNPWGANFEFTGLMDEVAFYKRSLSAAEILALYNNGVAGEPYCQPGNYAPLFKSEAVTTATEDALYTYSIMTGDYDVSDDLVITKVSGPAWLTTFTDAGDGTATLSGTPANGDVGNHNVVLNVSDGKLDIEQAFTIAVSNVNDAPVFTSTAVTAVNEDSPYAYAITTQDVDAGSSVTISSVNALPAWLTLTDLGNGTATLSGTPNNSHVGSVNVTLRVTDNNADSTDQAFTITVTNVNDAPVITGQSPLSTDEDENIVISLNDINVTDVDNNYPDDFELTILDGNHYTHSGATVIPEENWFGTLTVNMEVSDLATSTPGTLTITVNSVNDLPEFQSEPVTTATAGSAYEYWIEATDVEDAVVTFEVLSKPSWATFTYNTGLKLGLLQGTPTSSDPLQSNVVIKVTDGNSGTATQDFVITVAGGFTAVEDGEAGLLRVYPSPAGDFAYVKPGLHAGKGKLRIYTLTGVFVREFALEPNAETRLDLSGLSKGIYLYRIAEDKIETVGKLIKE